MMRKRRGYLKYNATNERYGMFDQKKGWIVDGFHCGDTMEVLIGEQWISTRMEMNWREGGVWYLLGICHRGMLDGLKVRV